MYASLAHNQSQLSQVIEPLASYICAADRPAETLKSVVARLLEEVKSTNAAAVRYYHVTSQHALELAL
jgi:hypothetical protein